MTLFNEMSMNNINGGSWVFSEDSFEAFRNGTRRTTDWNDLIISNVAPQTQHDISISGGNEKTKFYISMGYFYQEGIFLSLIHIFVAQPVLSIKEHPMMCLLIVILLSETILTWSSI